MLKWIQVSEYKLQSFYMKSNKLWRLDFSKMYTVIRLYNKPNFQWKCECNTDVSILLLFSVNALQSQKSTVLHIYYIAHKGRKARVQSCWLFPSLPFTPFPISHFYSEHKNWDIPLREETLNYKVVAMHDFKPAYFGIHKYLGFSFWPCIFN